MQSNRLFKNLRGVILTNSSNFKMSKKLKAGLVSAAAIIVVLCIAVIIGIIAGKNNPENSRIVVYSKNNSNIIRIDDKEKVISLEGSSGFKCDDKNSRVFFTTESGYSEGLFDLYYVEVEKGEITEPKLIDYAVEKNFSVSSGKVYYLKFNNKNSANDGCVCDIDENRIEVFSQNVEEIYDLEGTETVYFIKMHGNSQVLYEYSEGTPRELSRGIETVYSYDNDEKPHLLFERSSQSEVASKELYIVYSGESPELICDSVSTVMYDNYESGGNLYYFTTSKDSVSWSYVISDSYAETDLVMTKPKRTDFFSFFGISTEYNEALRKYQDKLVRDEIRETLNIMTETGEFSAPVFTAFAYNSNGTFKLAENIDPSKVYTVSAYGEPKIIFESVEVEAEQTDMDTLVTIAQRSTMAEVLDYARTLVAESVASKGMEITVYSEDSGPVVSALSEYDKTKTLFSFSDDGSRVYAFERGSQAGKLTLYTNSINSEHKVSDRENVSADVSSYWFEDDKVVYMKADIGKDTGDIYVYNGKESVKISNAANAFVLSGKEDVIVLKNNDHTASEPVADYYYCNEKKEELIGNEIIASTFVHNNQGAAAYITKNNRKLYVFDGEDAGVISDNVDEILFFN